MKTNKQERVKEKTGISAEARQPVPQKPGDSRHVWLVRKLSTLNGKAGFGLNEVIGIAAGIIIAVVVVIPGLQGFAGSILKNLTNWWNNMASSIFTTN